MKFTCVSADCHIDLIWLPPDLFTANASRDMRDQMPRVIDSPDGPLWVGKGAVPFGLVGGFGPNGRKYIQGESYRVDRMAAEGLYTAASQASRRVADPHQRIKDQDRDGVQAEILYGILGAVVRLDNREAAPEMYRIYNEWLAEFCRPYPERLLGLAIVSGTDVTAAVREARLAAERGLKGIEMATSEDMIPLVDRRWDPLWREINESRLPIHFHILGPKRRLSFDGWSEKETGAQWLVDIGCTPVTTASRYVASIIAGGALERYPNIVAVLGESGIGWIPYVLERLDYGWEERNKGATHLKMKPSEYWKRQCKATFQYDEVGLQLIDRLGVDTLMWGSDFPHGDGTWPNSQERIAKQFGHLPRILRQKIVCDNALACYGIG